MPSDRQPVEELELKMNDEDKIAMNQVTITIATTKQVTATHAVNGGNESSQHWSKHCCRIS